MAGADRGGGEFWGQDPMNSEKWPGAVGRSDAMANGPSGNKQIIRRTERGHLLSSPPPVVIPASALGSPPPHPATKGGAGLARRGCRARLRIRRCRLYFAGSQRAFGSVSDAVISSQALKPEVGLMRSAVVRTVPCERSSKPAGSGAATRAPAPRRTPMARGCLCKCRGRRHYVPGHRSYRQIPGCGRASDQQPQDRPGNPRYCWRPMSCRILRSERS